MGIGASILLKRNDRDIALNAGSKISSADTFDNAVIFWGLDKKVTSQNFKGGSITAIFGGAKIDLREAKIVENCNLDLTAIFGGVEVLVAENVNVETSGTGIFGGFDSKVPTRANAIGKINIQGEAILGGVEIK